MKLSRTGWNNVIIFSVMAFILIINATNNKLFSENENAAGQIEPYILGEKATILTLSVHSSVLIERVGKTWRATPSLIQGQALDQMMMSWQQSVGSFTQASADLDRSMALVIEVEIAEQEQPQTLHFYTTDTELLIFNQSNNQWMSFPLVIFSQLIPNEVLAS